jgi:hypothetical protein
VNGRDRVRLRSDRGQSLVFVVLTLIVIVGVFALVVDVGSWIRVQRHAQAVADAAALAGAQKLIDDPGEADPDARQYAELNMPGADVEVNPSPNSIEVDVERDAPGLFAPLIGFASSLRVGAHATARIEVPIQVNAVAPLALRCEDPPDCDPWGMYDDDTFVFIQGRPTPSSLATFRLPGLPNNDSSFDNWVQCDPRTPGSGGCYQPSATAGTTHPRLTTISANELDNELDDVPSWEPRLFAIYSSYGSGQYNVVGWANGYVEWSDYDDPDPGRPRTTVQIRFEPLLVKSTWVDGAGGNPDYDYGVRAIALTR